jgi:dihydrofolate reductase
MRKLIAAMNMTLDGFCDHTSMIADDELHEHYNKLLGNADALLYGRITYQLMESYWPTIVKNPTGNKPTDEFAILIDNIEKIVFSHTLTNEDPIIAGWKNAKLAMKGFEQEVLELKQSAHPESKDILVGSPSLIVAALNLNLVDELQLCVQPIIAGKGLRLFKNISERIYLKLLKTEKFNSSGSVVFYYEPVNLFRL